jgi:hypothetical protein
MPTAGLDYLLTAPDAWSLFGLERRFEVDLVLLEQRHAQLTQQARSFADRAPVTSEQLVQKLDEGRALLKNPVARGERLLSLLGGAQDPENDGVPPGFVEWFETFRRNPMPADMQQKREQLLENASRLFRNLGNADNAVVKRERRRQIRETLNAIRQLDQF